jgi:hypothetical protein
MTEKVERGIADICAEVNPIISKVTCALDAGHSGMHKARAPNGGVYSWAGLESRLAADDAEGVSKAVPQ